MKRSLSLPLLAVAAMLHATSMFALTVGEITDVAPKADENPVPIRTKEPVYPASLDGVAGLVTVIMVVDETGAVAACEVLKASHEDFKKPTVDAVLKWKFKPAKVAGKAVKVKLTMPVRFGSDL